MAVTIACTGGGTGGHVFPGIAVIDQLKKIGGSTELELVWIGSGKQIERDITRRFDVPYYAVPSGKLRRYFSLQNFLDIFKLAAGVIVSIRLLKKLKAGVLFSKGGYVAVAPVIAARILGIPILTHESDRDPGLATRIAARFADLILLPYEATRVEHFSKASGEGHSTKQRRVVVTGNPVREELFSGMRPGGRELLGLPEAEPLVLVLGGSQGARQVNRMLKAILPQLLEQALVVHQMGELDYEPSSDPRYITAALFHGEFSHILAAADVIISRAGAGTLGSWGPWGKHLILIPLGGESSRGDQVRNARLFAERGAAVMLEGDSLSSEALLEHIHRLLQNEGERRAMGQAAAELCPADAARRMAELIYSHALSERGSQ